MMPLYELDAFRSPDERDFGGHLPEPVCPSTFKT